VIVTDGGVFVTLIWQYDGEDVPVIVSTVSDSPLVVQGDACAVLKNSELTDINRNTLRARIAGRGQIAECAERYNALHRAHESTLQRHTQTDTYGV